MLKRINNFSRLPNHFAKATALFLALLLSVSRVSGATLDADPILQILKAKDAQFDNAHLRYEISTEKTIPPFPAWKFPEFAKEYGLENEKPQRVRFRYHEQLIVRGPNTTFIRNVDPSLQQEDGVTARPTQFQKWSNTEGLDREIIEHRGPNTYDRIMEIRAGGLPVDIAQEQRMAIEFALGFGFGRRIREIDSVSRAGDRIVVKGTIGIWWEDTSTFELELDEDYVVRRATIHSDVKGNLTRFEVVTEGLVQQEGFVLAKAGTFERIWEGRYKDGKKVGKPRVLKQFSLIFERIKPNLTDDEYETLTRMEVTPGTQVMDYVAGLSYIAGEIPKEVVDAGEHEFGHLLKEPLASESPEKAVEAKELEREQQTGPTAQPAAPGPDIRLLLAGLTVGVVIVGILSILWRRRQRSKTTPP